MMNHEIMTLKLSRTEVCDIRMALLHLVNEFSEEINDANISDDRRKVAEKSMEKWAALREKVIQQFIEQDAE